MDDEHDLLDCPMLVARLCHADERPFEDDPPCAAPLGAVREALERVAAVVDAADYAQDPPDLNRDGALARLWAALDGLEPGDWRLLRLDR